MKTPSSPDRKLMLRRVLHTIHLWIGVSLGIPFAILGATGSILAYEHEIIALFEGAEPKKTIGEAQPVSRIVEAARAKAPSGAVPSFYSNPADEPAAVRFTQPGRSGPGSATTVRIDPVTLATIDPPERSEVRHWVRQVFLLHANMFAGREGREWIGWFGVGMCFLGVSGLVMWWPRPGRWRQAFSFSRKSHGVRFNRELHSAFGFWGLAVFLVISFSGVYIVFPQTTGEIVRAVFPGRDLRGEANALRVTPIADATAMTVDEVVELAKREAPGLEMRMVSLPPRAEQPYRVAFELPGTTPGHGVPMVTVFIDPWQRNVLAMQDPRSYTLGETITIWQRALHGGYGLGWIWQFLTFLSGLLPVLFAATGITMWWLRRRRRKAQAAFAARTPSTSPAE
jgi:uncharacterized iron-regulated membrane protein